MAKAKSSQAGVWQFQATFPVRKMLVDASLFALVLILTISFNELVVSANASAEQSGDNQVRVGSQLEQQQQVWTRLESQTRAKRHTSSKTTTQRSDQNQTPKPDCAKLDSVFAYLSANYPSLAKHLFDWATQASNGHSSDAQFLFATTSQIANLVGRLLGEADRLLGLKSSGQQLGAAGNNHLKSAWLSRVSSSPAYAKLVQHLRRRQQLAALRAAPSERGQSQQPQQSSHSQSEPASGHVYGRVVHYPHEVGAGAGLNEEKPALDKLHTLRLQTTSGGKQTSEQQTELESNKIPSSFFLSDGARPAHEERNNVVYGNVILKPAQSEHVPIDTSSQFERLFAHRNLHNKNNLRQKQTAPQQDEQHSFGRVLVGPIEDLHQIAEEAAAADELQSERQHQRKLGGESRQQATSRQEAELANKDKSTLEALRRQIEVAAASAVATQAELANAELVSQQRAQQRAVFGPQDTDDEESFESLGEFHSSPLEQVEVRKLQGKPATSRTRGTSRKQDEQEEQIVVLTTSNPSEAFVVD